MPTNLGWSSRYWQNGQNGIANKIGSASNLATHENFNFEKRQKYDFGGPGLTKKIYLFLSYFTATLIRVIFASTYLYV